MPATISKVKNGYRVKTPNAVHAKNTTLEKAKSQKRLLNAVEHGWKPGKMAGNDIKNMVEGHKKNRMGK